MEKLKMNISSSGNNAVYERVAASTNEINIFMHFSLKQKKLKKHFGAVWEKANENFAPTFTENEKMKLPAMRRETF
jgi:hypothetical protein